MYARGVITDGAGGFVVDEFEIGDPGPGEVLVQIAASGLCHTDVDIARTADAGVILGHEGAGIVQAAGPGADDLAPGDHVILTWAISCGECFQCAGGNEVLCERLGTGPRGHAHPEAAMRSGASLKRAFNVGTLSTAAVVRREAVVPIDESVPLVSACLLGCGVMTGVGSVLNAACVAPGSSVVVIGCGGVGLNAIQGARIAGADVIVAVDVSEEKLVMAKRFGATHVVEAGEDDARLLNAAAAAREITGVRGADYAFECTGIPDLCVAPLSFVRHGGTAVQVSGTEQDVTVDMRLFEWDKVYMNPLYGKCRPRVDFPRLIQLYMDGTLMLDELVTKTYPLDAAVRAFDDLLAGRLAKGVIVP